jgi:WD40 repeat protein/tetratricopeptide (TPR) repeat protein
MQRDPEEEPANQAGQPTGSYQPAISPSSATPESVSPSSVTPPEPPLTLSNPNQPTQARLPSEPDGPTVPPLHPPGAGEGQRTATADAPLAVAGYELLSLLGRGGMGVVYQARHLALNRIVALKLIAGGGSSQLLARFRREGEAVAKLQHPNIVQIFEIGQTPQGMYIALEYIDGGSLRQQMAKAPLSPRDAARLVETLASAISHAHAKQLIHRDLKPDNILLTSQGAPKITDFGLARQLDSDHTVMTMHFVGTPAYAAPEQVDERFGQVSYATDVYALGVILYELLTGRVPFTGSSIGLILQKVTDNPPVPPRQLKRNCPRDLQTICLKCLQKTQSQRYTSAAELAEDLRRYLAGLPILARPVGPVERTLRWAKRNPAVASLLTLVFSLMLLTTIGAVIAALRIDQARRDAQANARQAQQDRDSALQAEREGKRNLLDTLMAEAQANNRSWRIGQRYDTLATVRKAVALAKELDEPSATFDKLREIAANALALPDIRISEPVKIEPGVANAVDPTGERLVSITMSGQVRVIRLSDGVEISRLADTGPVRHSAIAFSPDGQFAYLACDKFGVRRWRMDTSEPETLIPPVEVTTENIGHHLRVTPDGRHLLRLRHLPALNRTQASVHELPGGRAIFSRFFHTEKDDYRAYQSIVLAPDGRRLAVAEGSYGDRNRIPRIIDLQTGQPIGQYQPDQRDSVLSMVWLSDSRILAVGLWSSTIVDLWDTQTKQLRARLRDLRFGAPFLGTSNDGQLLYGHSTWQGKGLVCWHPHTGSVYFQNRSLPTFVYWQPLLSGGATGCQVTEEGIRVVRLESSPVLKLVAPQVLENVVDARTCAIHPAGRLLALGTEKGAWLFDLDTGAEVAKLPLQGTFSVDFCPRTGDLLTNGGDGTFRWPVQIAANVVTLGPPLPLLSAVGNDNLFRLSSDGRLLAATRYQHALLLDPTGCKHRLPVPLGPFGSARNAWFVGPNSNRYVQVYDHDRQKLFVYDSTNNQPVTDPEQLKTLLQPSEPGSIDDWGRLLLLDPKTGNIRINTQSPNQSVYHSAILSQDRTVLCYINIDTSSIHAWDLRALRKHLAELGLDWDAPPYPPAPPPPPGGRAAVPALTARYLGSDAIGSYQVRRECALFKATVELTANPLDPEAHYVVAEQIYPLDPDNALRHLNVTLSLQPDHEGALCLRSKVCLRLGQKDRALSDAERAKATGTRALLPCLCRADALMVLERYADALPELSTILQFFPADFITREKRATCYRMLKQTELAEADLQQAFSRLDRTDPIHLNNSAWRMVTGPADQRYPEWALRLIQAALKRSPQTATFHNTHGVVLYRLGRYVSAVEALEESLRLHQGKDLGYDLLVLAMCRAKLGQLAQARDDYQRATDWLAQQKDLSARERLELAEFRAEAQAVLREAGLKVD